MNEEEVKALSIIADKNEISLKNNPADYAASAIKSVAGEIPLVGGLLQEAVNILIPNQRQERIAQTMEIFMGKVAHIENGLLKQKMLSDEFADLLQDAIPQAARSLSDERREHIASVLENSLTEEDLDHLQQKKLLSILGELNDIEIIYLRSESIAYSEHREFRRKHREALEPSNVSDDIHIEAQKRAIRESYQNKLYELGLLEKTFVRIERDDPLPMDKKTGMLASDGHRLTLLGRALLRFIGQPAFVDRRREEAKGVEICL